SPANKQEVDTFVAANAKYQEKQKKYNQVFSEGERLDIAEGDLAKEAAAMELALKNGTNMKMRYGAFFKSYPAHAWMLSAWKTEASQELCDFFDLYVHDSRTDFLSGIEPSSYFSKRGIEESSEAVWQQASRWVGDKAHQAENAVEGAYDATKKKTVETYDAAKKKTVETYDAAKKTTSDAYDAAETKTVDTYQSAKKKTGELIDAGEHKISEAYDATKHMANDAANSVAHTSDEIYQAGKQGISKGTHAVENVASDAANTLSEGWKNLTSLTK
ncbi:MAG: hypothetical protein NTY70_18030, partial [Burkholderiales bacterium]|nr:hypothetical protein [Burkholderiales bacterium]